MEVVSPAVQQLRLAHLALEAAELSAAAATPLIGKQQQLAATGYHQQLLAVADIPDIFADAVRESSASTTSDASTEAQIHLAMQAAAFVLACVAKQPKYAPSNSNSGFLSTDAV